MVIWKRLHNMFKVSRPATAVVGAGPAAALRPIEVRQEMQRAAVYSLIEVDTYRQQLAGNDRALQQVLGGIELTLARQLGRQVRTEPDQ